MTRSFRFLPLLLALAVSGCGLFGGSRAPEPGPGEPEPDEPVRPTTVEIAGTGTMNAGGNAARVYLYALASEATFLSTPVQVFWNDPEGTLGSDIVGASRDATARPGGTVVLEDLVLGDAAFLGVAADLRTPVGTTWRAVIPASEVRGHTVRVTVTEGGLTVTSQ